MKMTDLPCLKGRSDCAMVPGKLPVSGRLTNLLILGRGLNALATSAGEGCLDFFFSSIICLLSLSLWETV